MPVIVKAIDRGVDAALNACREAQVEKQMEVLTLGLRGLRADEQKFAHVPEIAFKISETIQSLENSIQLLDVATVPDIYIEDYIDVEQRRADETPLEFRLKVRLNDVYKNRYLALMPNYENARKSMLADIESRKQSDIHKAKLAYREKNKNIKAVEITGEETDGLNKDLRLIEEKSETEATNALSALKDMHKIEIAKAQAFYDSDIFPLLRQLNVEIVNKHFNITILELKRLFEEGSVKGLTLDVNSLSFYAFLSQSLDRLGKLDLVGSIGLPFIEKIVKQNIPITARESDTISDKILGRIAGEIGIHIGSSIKTMIDEPIENLRTAVEYSEHMAILDVPDSDIVIPFMDYYIIDEMKVRNVSSKAAPITFFQAIESISKADGVLDTLKSVKGLYSAISSGSQAGCLDESENVFDSMNQGIRDELLRQRYHILDQVSDSLFAFNDLPDAWLKYKGEISEVQVLKIELDNEFIDLNKKYKVFSGSFNLLKSGYDKAKKALEEEKLKIKDNDYVKLENKKAKELIAKCDVASMQIEKACDTVMNELILKIKKERYAEVFSSFKQATTRDKVIKKYFETHIDSKLELKIDKTRMANSQKKKKLIAAKSNKIANALDKKYKVKIDAALAKHDVLQACESKCIAKRNEMATLSRKFSEEAQKFKNKRSLFNESVNSTLKNIERLPTTNGNMHLWQLKMLAGWSADELGPLDIVVNLLEQVGDKIKASAVTYSDVFRFATEETARKRKMKAEVGRGNESGIVDKLKQSTGEMIGGSLVDLKVGEQLGYLRSFAENIAPTLATENRVVRIREQFKSESLAESLAARHDILTHASEMKLTPELTGKLIRFFSSIADFFKSLSPFNSKKEQKEVQIIQKNAKPLVHSYSGSPKTKDLNKASAQHTQEQQSQKQRSGKSST